MIEYLFAETHVHFRTLTQSLIIAACSSLGCAQTISIGGIVNAASFQPGIAPGSIISIFGANLATATGAASIPLPTALGTTSVLVNGKPAPLFYVSPTQINAQLPYETAVGSAILVVTVNGSSTAPAALSVQASAPGIMVSAVGRAIALNQDGSLNGPYKPTLPGTVLTVYMTGQGPVDRPVPTGAASPDDPMAHAILPVTATIGGKPAQVVAAGLTPGGVGLFQVEIQIPEVSGDLPLVVTVGETLSNSATVTVGWQLAPVPGE
jgi:uncharacterized protein (TIGR03437 family)